MKHQVKVIKFLTLTLWCCFLTWLAYGDSLTLPFFFDDFVHLPNVETFSFWQLVTTRVNTAYYRPLNFIILKLAHVILGYHNPLLHHLINLVFHAANGILVGLLATQITTSHIQANNQQVDKSEITSTFLASTFYLLFPFTYQTVPWVGALNHLLVTFCLLMSLFAYLKKHQTNQLKWNAVGFLFVLFALFTHENGILAPVLIITFDIVMRSQRRWRKLILDTIGWVLPLFIWFPIWISLPPTNNSSQTLNGLEAIWQNTTYFLQGMAYPFTWVGGDLRSRYGWNDLVIVWGLSIAGFGIAAFIQYRAKTNGRSLYACIWSILSVIPAIMFLSFNYVISGPRLLTLTSVGLAWGWAEVAKNTLFHFHYPTRWYIQHIFRVFWIICITALLWQNHSFIRKEMLLHNRLGKVMYQTVDVANEANQVDRSVVVINFPSWVAPEPTYALGHEGVLFWPAYVPQPVLVSVHTGKPADLILVWEDTIRSHVPYFYGLTGESPDWDLLSTRPSDVWVALYTSEAIEILPVGKFMLPPSAKNVVAEFLLPDKQVAISLLETQVSFNANKLQVDLLWQTNSPIENVTVFLHLLNENGQLIAQSDGDPLANTYPFSSWQPEQPVWDIRHIPLTDLLVNDPSGTILNDWSVAVGLYNRLSGERLQAITVDGTIFPEGAVLITP